MARGEFIEGDEDQQSNDENRNDPRGNPPVPVTPKMLIKALKRLRKTSFKRLLFTPREITYEILDTYSLVEQDPVILLLEVSDKLICAAAASLLGTKQDLAYFAFDAPQEASEADYKSELMFWVYYKRLLEKKKKERRRDGECNGLTGSASKEKLDGGKTVRRASFSRDHLHFPLVRYRRKTLRKS